MKNTPDTKLLRTGENALGMYVGDGWYYCQNSLPDMKVNYQHAVFFQIEVTYSDGTTAVFGSDETVKAAYGPIRSSDLYGGEVYDATQEIPGWDTPGLDDTGWKNGKVIQQDLTNLRAQLGEPVEAVMELPVKEVLHSPKGETILDFGQNLCGRVRMTLDVPAGITVMTAFYTRYLENVACDQDKFGVVPQVVPYNGSYVMMGRMLKLAYGTKGKATSSGWGDMAVITPYRMYEATGNTLILRKQYNSMKRWCDYVIHEAKTGKPKKSRFRPENEPYLWDTGYHYGEWLVPSQNKNGMDMKILKAIMESSSVYTAPIFGWISVSYFAKIAHILGNTADEAKYQTTDDKMKNAIVAELIDKDGNCVSDMMGAYVLFLYFDLVPEQFQDKFAMKLVQSIEANGGCLDTGFLATPYLLDTLTKCSCAVK